MVPPDGEGRTRSCFHLRLLSELSPQRGQGQAPSPHDSPHSHRCNRRALLGSLCHPPHIPLPGSCRLWGGPGDLPAPSQGQAGRRGRWGPGVRPERGDPLDPGIDNFYPKEPEGHWDWSFLPAMSKGRDQVKGRILTTKWMLGNGYGWEKLWERRVAGGLDTGQSMDIMTDEDSKTKTERQREEKGKNVRRKMDPGMACDKEGNSFNTNIEDLL